VSKKLLILSPNRLPDRAREEAEAGVSPRIDYLVLQDRMGGDLVDSSVYDEAAGIVERADRLLRLLWYQAFHVVRQWASYDAVLSLGEDIGLPLEFLLRLKGIRTRHVLVAHNLASPRKRLPVRLLGVLRRFDMVLTLSGAEADELRRRFGLGETSVRTLTYSRDGNFWGAAPDDVPDAQFFLSVGRAKRDYQTLVDAFTGLDAELRVQTGSRWTIAGGGGRVEQELPPNVIRGEYVTNLEMRALYGQATAVVISLERGAHASAGLATICEAMAAGRPVILATDAEDQDYVLNNKTGLVVSADDTMALRAAIERIASDPGLSRAMGEAARQRFEARHSLDKYVDELEAALIGRSDEK